jgi:hypothetical protein
MLTAEEKAAFSEMKMQGNLSDDEIDKMIGALAMDRYGAMTVVPSLDANYIMKLLRESHISNTAAAEISQKSLSVALTYISQHPINNEA